MDEVNGTNGTPATTEVVVSSGETRDEEGVEDVERRANDEATTECIQSPPIIPQIVPHMHMPPQHYVYPGHFMFGPPMVNMNGKIRLIVFIKKFQIDERSREKL